MDAVFVKVGHRHRELGGIARVLNATDNIPSVYFGHTILVDSDLVIRDVPERNRSMACSGVNHVGADRHDGIAWQRSAHGQRLEKEAECVIGFPIAPLEHLVQPESRLGIERRRVSCISIRERNLVASRAVDRGRYHKRAHVVGSNADRNAMHRLVIRHARRPDGRHVLEHIEGERLARVVLREVQVGKQGRLVRDTRSTGLGIHKRARAVAAKQRRSSVIGASDVEGEFALVHIATVERLAQDESSVVAFRRITVGEVKRVLDRPRCRKHAVVVGHRHHNCGCMAIERHALRAISGNPLAVPRIFAHHEGVRTRLGKRCIAEGEVDRLAVRPSQRNSVGTRQTDSAVRDGRLRRVIAREQHEPEGLVWKHVAPSEGLGARREVLGGNAHGFRRVGIAEGCERFGRRALRRVGKLVARRPNHNRLIVDYLARNVYPDDPRGLIVDHPSLKQRRVSVGNVDPVASTIRHQLGDAVLERLADHVAREDDVPKRHAAVGINCADRVCGHRGPISDRLDAEVEHTARKGIRTRVVGVFLLHRGIPFRFPRGEFVGERCGVDAVIGLDARAVVIGDLHHDARHIQYALMDGIIALARKLFGHRDNHAIARLRQGHASSGAHALILADLINVRTGLRVSDVAERASRITAVNQVLLGKGKHAIGLAILAKRHRSVVGRGGKDETEGVVVGPATTGQHLLDGKGIVVIERAARTIGVGEFSRRLRTSSDRSHRSLRFIVFRRSYLIETSRRLLADEVFPARAQTADNKRLAILERMRRLTAVVKRDGERIAHGLIIHIADFGGEFLPLRLVNLDGKGERVVGKIGTIVALGDDQRLGDSQRAWLLDDELSVVAQMAGNVAPRPQGVEHRRRRRRRIAILRRAQLIDIGNARSTRLEYRVAGSIGTNIAEQRLRDIARELDGARPRRRLPVANIIPAALVVIRAVCVQRTLGGHRARLIRVNRRFLGHVVIAVGLRRSERRQDVAVFAAAPLVRIERHTVAGRIRLDIGGKRRIRIRQGALHVFLHARLEEHANGERHVDVARACRFVNLEMTQRDERRGNLHFDKIARRQIV